MDTALADPAAAAAKASGLRTGMIGYMLAHEQFTVPELVDLGAAADHIGQMDQLTIRRARRTALPISRMVARPRAGRAQRMRSG